MSAAQQLTILDEPRPAKLVGIARLASEGEHLRDGYNVEFFTLPSRSILNRCTSRRHMPFTWTVNPYRGCEFACKYCYARYTHEFMELRDNVEFERKIYVKQQAALHMRSELRKVKPGEEIAIGTATDPYQPAEKRFEVTRSILEVLAEYSGHEIGLVTKSDLVLRDLELWRRIAERNSVFVHLTITTLDTALARILEPRAPRPDLRLDAVRKLSAAGVPAGVIVAPVMPGITDNRDNLEAIVRATRDAGGQYIYANPLFLKPCSASIFMPFIEQHFPHLAEDYRSRYQKNAFLPAAYQREISGLMADLRREYGFVSKDERRAASAKSSAKEPSQGGDAEPAAEQLALF